MKESILIKLSEKLSPVMRKLQDVFVDLVGRDAQVLKITRGTPNIYGVSDDTYSSEIINNCIIKYPLSEVEAFDQTENAQTDITSISLMDILPIELQIKYAQSATNDAVIGLEPGDIIVDILKDEQGNKLPVRLEVPDSALKGEFFGRFLVKKVYELTLVRGTFSSDVETLITNYVNDFS